MFLDVRVQVCMVIRCFDTMPILMVEHLVIVVDLHQTMFPDDTILVDLSLTIELLVMPDRDPSVAATKKGVAPPCLRGVSKIDFRLFVPSPPPDAPSSAASSSYAQEVLCAGLEDLCAGGDNDIMRGRWSVEDLCAGG